jgi:hypothetical protein
MMVYLERIKRSHKKAEDIQTRSPALALLRTVERPTFVVTRFHVGDGVLSDIFLLHEQSSALPLIGPVNVY